MHSLVLRDFSPEKGHEIENGQLGEQDLFFASAVRVDDRAKKEEKSIGGRSDE